MLRILSPVVFFFFLFSFLGGACVFVVFKYVCILTSHVLALCVCIYRHEYRHMNVEAKGWH